MLTALAMASIRGLTQTCTVDWNNVHQRIDGFGASSAWQSTWTTTETDLFFSTNNGISYTDIKGNSGTYNGIGLSLLRNHIYYADSTSSSATPTTTEISIMTNAQARGALIWSTPWTPAAGFKSTNDIYDALAATGDGIDGGSYLGSGNNATNVAYASQLANYVLSMKNSYGINLYAISIQNEPDASVNSYEACQWSQAQMHDFVTNLYAALVAKGVSSTKILLPESQNWTDPKGLASTALSDPNVAGDVGIVADHDYVANNQVGDLTTPAELYPASGKSTWETEVSQIGGSFDGSISNGIYWAWRIHLYMTAAQANAWHYWWLVSDNSDNEGLTDNSSPTTPVLTKRMFVLGQWSRFVRPGYCRIDTSTTAGSAFISAFSDTNSGNFAIVAVNTNGSTAINQTFIFTNFPIVTSVTPWITSATLSLSSQTPISVSGSSFTYTLPAQSVVTFVGQATMPPYLLVKPPTQDLPWIDFYWSSEGWTPTDMPFIGLQTLPVGDLGSGEWTAFTGAVRYYNVENQFVARDQIVAGAGVLYRLISPATNILFIPPAATTPATSITSNNATLNATTTPYGFKTLYWFEYGTDTRYGVNTPANSLTTATNPTDLAILSYHIGGLNPVTVYHFQLVVTDDDGTQLGGDQQFTTAGVSTNYVGNTLTAQGFEGADGVPPLVILGEYSPAGPLATSTVTLPTGMVQDVKFYGQNYNFTLYALSLITSGPSTSEQTFQVVASQSFSNSVASVGIQTLGVTNFSVYPGDLLAFAGTGPYYPQTTNDAYNSDATYEDSSNPGSFTATPPGGPGTEFIVGLNSDTNATYGCIPDVFMNQGRTYAIGVDVSVP